MNKLFLSFFIFITIIPITSFSYSTYSYSRLENLNATGPEKVGRSDSGIEFPAYQHIVSDLINTAKTYPEYSELINIGSTEDNISTYGILLYNKKIEIKNLILITGATHGNEFLNIANRLPDAFLNENNKSFYNFFDRGGAFFIIPVVNPYGFSNRTRTNANNIDINRDFTNIITNKIRFTQKESQNYANWIAMMAHYFFPGDIPKFQFL